MSELIDAGSGKKKKRLKSVRDDLKRNGMEQVLEGSNKITDIKPVKELGWVSPYWHKHRIDADLERLKKKSLKKNKVKFIKPLKGTFGDLMKGYINLDKVVYDLFNGSNYIVNKKIKQEHSIHIFSEIPQLPEVEIAYLFQDRVYFEKSTWKLGLPVKPGKLKYRADPAAYNLNVILKPGKYPYRIGISIPLIKDISFFNKFATEEKIPKQAVGLLSKAYAHTIIQQFFETEVVERYGNGFYSANGIKNGILAQIRGVNFIQNLK